MMSPNEQDDADGELVESAPADPYRAAFGAACAAVIEMLPDGYARQVAVTEIMQAFERTKAALIRRYVN